MDCKYFLIRVCFCFLAHPAQVLIGRNKLLYMHTSFLVCWALWSSLVGYDVISSGWTPRGPRCRASGPVSSFFSSVYEGNMAILISRVSLQSEEVVYETLFTQELPMTEVWWWRGAQIQAKKGPWLAICRALVSPSPLNTGTLSLVTRMWCLGQKHTAWSAPSSQNITSLYCRLSVLAVGLYRRRVVYQVLLITE